MHYAQLDVPIESGGWDAVVAYIDVIGPRISALRKEQRIGMVTIDFAVALREGSVSLSVGVPSYAAETIGRHGIDIEFSVYLTN